MIFLNFNFFIKYTFAYAELPIHNFPIMKRYYFRVKLGLSSCPLNSVFSEKNCIQSEMLLKLISCRRYFVELPLG